MNTNQPIDNWNCEFMCFNYNIN